MNLLLQHVNPRTVARFNKFTKRTGPDECWIWTGSRRGPKTNKYGAIYIKNKKIGHLTVAAHRFSWVMHNAVEIPPGMFVCHKCDNPPCVNPYHFFLGTCADNMKDAKDKGRKVHREDTKRRLAEYKGDRHKGCKLSDAQVEQVRNEYAAGGVTQQQLAKKYGVFNTTICQLVKHRYRSDKAPIERRGNAILYEKHVILIRKLYNTGDYSYNDLAFLFGVGFNAIALIVRRDTWKHIPEDKLDNTEEYPGIV